MLRLTPRALDALRAADTAAKRFNPDARIRLSRTAAGVQAGLTDGPEPGDDVLEIEGLSLLVEPGLVGTIDAGEHQVLTLGP